MKKLFSVFLIALFAVMNAQEGEKSNVTANRFFYELTFKPKRDSAKVEKVMTVLDITKDKSIYRDYTMIAQDSIMKVEIEAMQKSGVYKDMSKMIRMPKFSMKVDKVYPEMKILYVERVANGFTPMNIAYAENISFNWKISADKEKIGAYTAQKATAEYGGRTWMAWFTTELPFQDGPYKFHGLPGLIVKVEDGDKNYSWMLQGNKKVNNFEELSYAEKISGGSLKITEVPREKFNKTFSDFKKDPLASARPFFKPEMMSQKMPGSDMTIGEMVKQQEKMYKDFYNANDNPIETTDIAMTGKPTKSKK